MILSSYRVKWPLLGKGHVPPTILHQSTGHTVEWPIFNNITVEMHHYGEKRPKKTALGKPKQTHCASDLSSSSLPLQVDEEGEVSLSMLGQIRGPAVHDLRYLRPKETTDPCRATTRKDRRATGNIVSCPWGNLHRQLLVLEPGHLPAFFWVLPRPLRSLSCLEVKQLFEETVTQVLLRRPWQGALRCPRISDDRRQSPVCLGHRWKGCDVTAFPSWSFPSHLSGATANINLLSFFFF